ncbi:MAG TPA: FG-GAP-like repeat-containing protein, partial [Fimbriiglobus sp.]|nr:FG-GAP-like repeat-containing protein [Fimbriiglobus sp.]
EVEAVVALPDGKVLFAGQAQAANYPDYGAVVGRLNSDGSPDLTFDGDGIALLPGVWYPGMRLAVLPDGRAVVAGGGRDEAAGPRVNWVVRLTADGALDPTFDGNGVLGLPQPDFPDPSASALSRVTAVAVAADGRVVLAGEVARPHEPFFAASDFGVLRLTADGLPDEAFGPGGLRTVAFDQPDGFSIDRPAALAVLPDGSVLVAGHTSAAIISGGIFVATSMSMTAAVARLTADGELDPTFGDGGKLTFDFPGAVTAELTDIEVMADGRVVLAGNANRVLPQIDFPIGWSIFAAARLTADGQLDPTFDGDGRVTVGGPDWFRTGTVFEVGVLPDGRVVLAGQARRPTFFPLSQGSTPVAAVVCLTADGAPDATFGRGGLFAFPFGADPDFDQTTSAAVLPDGRTLLGGNVQAQPAGTQTDLGFAMLLADPGPDSVDLSYPPEWDEPSFVPPIEPPIPPPPVEPPVPPRTRAPIIPVPPGEGVVTADVNGDGVEDVVSPAGPTGSRVRVVNGVDGSELSAVAPFEDRFVGRVQLAAADLDGDGQAEVIAAAGAGGGPRVVVYRGADLAAGTALAALTFFGIDDPAFRGGARVALGDVNGDGTADLVVAAGPGGGPRVALFDGRSLGGAPVKLQPDFFAFEATLRGGVFVAAGDVDGDGAAEIAFGGGPGGAPRVRLFDGTALLAAGPFANVDEVPVAQRANFFAGDAALRDGVRLALRDADGDGRADLVTGSGEGEPSQVYRSMNLLTNPAPTPDQGLDPFGAVPAGGVFVG